MENEIRQKVESSPGLRMARWILPWMVLGAVLVTVISFTGRFREASEQGAVTTATVDASSTTVPTETATGTAHMPNAGTAAAPVAKAGSVTIAQALVEGILLRKEPSANGEVIARLGNGTKMTVIEQTDQWLKVREPKGQVGWIRNNDNLISLKSQ